MEREEVEATVVAHHGSVDPDSGPVDDLIYEVRATFGSVDDASRFREAVRADGTKASVIFGTGPWQINVFCDWD